jgi:hypothetical protein
VDDALGVEESPPEEPSEETELEPLQKKTAELDELVKTQLAKTDDETRERLKESHSDASQLTAAVQQAQQIFAEQFAKQFPELKTHAD